ncbi:Prevent-host-death protein [Beggiatoa sp. PS]|nr:Prevent-host-death protein [Beggiatoa sp. PS]
MQAIEFDSYVNEGTIKIPANYQDWYGAKIKVILLRQDTLISKMEAPAVSRSQRPIGLAKDQFQVPSQFFEELPEDLLDAFEGKR